ncbi:MAG: iron ABC transporter permease [Rhodospirillales bacterium]|nr:iron ABC transporter permease [Rhodospirillales bacterium]MSP80406.1 iron ABC transporter permease [Rhodospirillales bacterium]
MRLSPLVMAAIFIGALLILPIAAVAVHSFAPGQGTWAHLAATVLPSYVGNTLGLAVLVGIGVVLVGVPAAWMVAMCEFPGRRVFEWALVLPLAAPAYVAAYAYTDFFQPAGAVQTALRALTGWQVGDYWFPDIRSLPGAAVMFVAVLYPYVYLLARAAFLEQSAGMIEAARALGCTAWAAFVRVAIPLARPAIVAGMTLALMETLADFGTVAYFGVPTFTVGIYRAWFALNDPVAAAQLSLALLLFVALLIATERQSRGQARYFQTAGRSKPLPRYRLRGGQAAMAVLACALPLLFGFIGPTAILVGLTFAGEGARLGTRFLGLAVNTLTLAVFAALIAVAVSLLLAYARRLHPGRWTGGAAGLAGMGYAMPGSIIAVGVLIPLGAFDNAVDAWMRATFGVSTGLLLTGTVAALIFAYLVRFLAVSLQTVEASLAKITPAMDGAARTLGAGPGRVLARVHAPLLRPSLLAALLIVFVDVTKELPATLLLRPFNFDTLAVHAYNLAADERLAEAAAASLGIVAAGLLPIILLARAAARTRTEAEVVLP